MCCRPCYASYVHLCGLALKGGKIERSLPVARRCQSRRPATPRPRFHIWTARHALFLAQTKLETVVGVGWRVENPLSLLLSIIPPLSPSVRSVLLAGCLRRQPPLTMSTRLCVCCVCGGNEMEKEVDKKSKKYDALLGALPHRTVCSSSTF